MRKNFAHPIRRDGVIDSMGRDGVIDSMGRNNVIDSMGRNSVPGPWAGRMRWAPCALALLVPLVLEPAPVLALNGDALPDVVFANSGANNRLCIQNGLLGLRCSDVSPNAPDAAGVALGDLDEDGNLDAVFANVTQRNSLCFGDGQGSLDDCFVVSSDLNVSNDVAVGDVNNDGHLDAVFANDGLNRVCLGDGSGSLDDCGDVSADAVLSYAVALGDVNGNGDLDALFANAVGAANRLCLGDGKGGFACDDIAADQSDNSRGLALADLNQDGDLDVVIANGGLFATQDRNKICFGDGKGGFSCSLVSLDAFDSYGVALGDVDDDGDLDGVFANDGVNRLCLSSGNGLLNSCSDVSSETDASTAVVLDDLNGDRFFDAIFANGGQPNSVCLSNGSGPLDNCSDIEGGANDSRGLVASRLGTYCDSGARSVTDLRVETGVLNTSDVTKNQLINELDQVARELEDGDYEKARDRVNGFISLAIRKADVSNTPDDDEITLQEADSLVCGAGNLIIGVPEETASLTGRGRK